MNVYLSTIIIAFLQFFLRESLCANPTVNISDGKVTGISNSTIEKNTTYYTFRAIPYAKPPTGNLRFKSPQKPDPWNNTLNGTADGADCLQMGDSSTVIGSEDCLFINVYTPDLNMNDSLAVMVWIYGGAFLSGSGSYENYRPDYFLDEQIVYVSFNYRLGALGWLSTEDEYCPGNFGLKDQLLALKWVQENIVHFGGDPENVTIFGESAGSVSVSYLLQSNLTEGLFKAAIMESGTSLNLWALQTEPSTHAFKLGVQMGIVTTDSKTLIESLLEEDASDIIIAQDTVFYLVFLNNALAGLAWGPVVEPYSNESAFSGHSHELLSNGTFRQVPMIVGYNSDELGALYDYLLALSLLLLEYDLDNSKLAPFDLSSKAAKKLSAGYAIKSKYFGSEALVVQPEKVVPFATNDQFIRPIREFVNLTSQFTDVYYYRFAYVGDLGGDMDSRSYWGVAHAEELNYLFVSDNSASDEDIVVRKRMVKLWTNFAKNSDPYYSTSTDRALLTNNTISQWIPARVSSSTDGTLDSSTTSASSGSLHYLNIASSLLMASNPNQTDWAFYRDDIYAIYGDRDYTTY